MVCGLEIYYSIRSISLCCVHAQEEFQCFTSTYTHNIMFDHYLNVVSYIYPYPVSFAQTYWTNFYKIPVCIILFNAHPLEIMKCNNQALGN